MYCESEGSEAEVERGIFSDAAVEGFMSWVGEGARLMDAVWMVDASSMAGFDAIVREST